jgi:hypothetical protein
MHGEAASVGALGALAGGFLRGSWHVIETEVVRPKAVVTGGWWHGGIGQCISVK